jgi:hypothetical protein
MGRRRTGMGALAALLVQAALPGMLAAQAAFTPIEAEGRREVVGRLSAALERLYVSPDTARLLAAHLRAREAAGAYEGAASAEELGRLPTAEVRDLSGDLHLSVRPAATAGARARVPPRAPPSGAAGRAVALGFTHVERLEGNVGYIQVGGALSGEEGDPAVGAAVAELLRAIDRTDAVILDLRASPGGSAWVANLLVSHFLPPGVHTFSVYSRSSGRTVPRRTLRDVPGPRRLDVPLYVLTSGSTFSAGEDIAWVLRSQGRATVVGERTGGAGRNNAYVPVGHGLTASISMTRVIDPRTGEEAWERVGVLPHVEVPAPEALEAALRHARRGASR